MSLSGFIPAAKRFWWLGLAVFVACVGLGALLAFLPEEQFQAEATIVVRPSEELGSNIQGVRFVLPSLAEQAASPENYDVVRTQLPPELQDADWDVSVSTEDETLLMFVEASSSDPDVVVPVANRFARRVVEERTDDRLVVLALLSPASTVTSTGQSRGVLFGAGIGLGVISGILAILAAAALRPRVGTARDVRKLGLTVLAEFPDVPRMPSGPASIFTKPDLEPVASSIERLRIAIAAYRARNPRSGARNAVAVCSVARSEGKTFVTASLAWAIGSVGQAVTAIDADLRHPALHDSFGLANGTGLADEDPAGVPIVGNVPQLPALGLVTAGRLRGHPSEVIGTNLPPVLAELRTAGELVLVDTPALSDAPEALIAASLTGSVILVIDAGRRTPDEVQEAAYEIDGAGAELIGVVLNRSAQARRRATRWRPAGRARSGRSADGEASASDDPAAEPVRNR